MWISRNHCSAKFQSNHCSAKLQQNYCSTKFQQNHCSDKFQSNHCSDKFQSNACSAKFQQNYCSKTFSKIIQINFKLMLVQQSFSKIIVQQNFRKIIVQFKKKMHKMHDLRIQAIFVFLWDWHIPPLEQSPRGWSFLIEPPSSDWLPINVTYSSLPCSLTQSWVGKRNMYIYIYRYMFPKAMQK